MADYTEDIRLAHLLADSADAITEERFRAQDLKIETKPDHTEVTGADRSVEKTIRSMISSTRQEMQCTEKNSKIPATGLAVGS